MPVKLSISPLHDTSDVRVPIDTPQLGANGMPIYERLLSKNELSYFLPSRANGANDLSLSVTFHAPPSLVTPARVSMAWAIMRLRHTLLASKVDMPTGHYTKAKFVYIPPASPQDAILEAERTIEVYDDRTVEDINDAYINGPRLLSTERISVLSLAQPRRPIHKNSTHNPVFPAFPDNDDDDRSQEFGFFLGEVHCIIDGISAHMTINEVFTLLGGEATCTDQALMDLLVHEWTVRTGAGASRQPIPAPAESRVPCARSKFEAAAQQVDFESLQQKHIGGHAFPRKKGAKRHCVHVVWRYSRAQTRNMLAQCKGRGLTVSNTLFAVINLAWIRTMQKRRLASGGEELPMLMYTAINLRPRLAPLLPQLSPSYSQCAIAYMNIILPSFLPRSSDLKSTFWNRAKAVNSMKKKYLASPLLAGRVHATTAQRADRALAWALEDDIMAGIISQPPSAPPPAVTSSALTSTKSSLPPAPSAALIGLTLLGNVDSMYDVHAYPSITPTKVFCDTRKNKGAMLMLAYSFRGALELTLGWDDGGYDGTVVRGFWEEVQDVIGDIFGVGNAGDLSGDLRARL